MTGAAAYLGGHPRRPGTGRRLVGRDGGPLSLDGFKRTSEFCLTAVFDVMRLASATMARQEPVEGGRGVIVNTASIAAYGGQIGSCPTPRPRAA